MFGSRHRAVRRHVGQPYNFGLTPHGTAVTRPDGIALGDESLFLPDSSMNDGRALDGLKKALREGRLGSRVDAAISTGIYRMLKSEMTTRLGIDWPPRRSPMVWPPEVTSLNAQTQIVYLFTLEAQEGENTLSDREIAIRGNVTFGQHGLPLATAAQGTISQTTNGSRTSNSPNLRS